MMQNSRVALDHASVSVADPGRAHAACRKPGVTLTASSKHVGSREPRGPAVPWRSGNHCAMFRHGYLEPICIAEPALYTQIGDRPGRHEGAHGIAFGLEDADKACDEIGAPSGLVEAPVQRERLAPFGRDDASQSDASQGLAQFHNVHAIPETTPECYIPFIPHSTRDAHWQPHLPDHSNGATVFAGIAICVTDPDATCVCCGRMFRYELVRHGADVVVCALTATQLYALNETGLGKRVPGVSAPTLPSVGSDDVRAADFAATWRCPEKRRLIPKAHPCPAAAGSCPRDRAVIHPGLRPAEKA